MADTESNIQNRRQTSLSHEDSPLLPSDRQHLRSLPSDDFITCHVRKLHGENTWVWRLRNRLQRFLGSKWGHYFVLVLVSLDISCIFADFLIELHVCEHGGEKGFDTKSWLDTIAVLGHVSLTFSSLFMAELLGSVFAFGPSYFKSWFHIFDASVIVTAFIIDILLTGPLEEAGSLVVILRLWRVFKIVEEFSTGAEGEMAALQERVAELEQRNEDILKENQELRFRTRHLPDGRATADGGLYDGE